MLKKINDVFENARRLEATIAERVEGAATRVTGGPGAREPLDTAHAIVDLVAREIQATGRGHRGFPFNQVRITLLAPTPRAKARLQAVIDGPDPLRDRITSRLATAGCDVDGLMVTVAYATKAKADWVQPDFDVECLRVDAREVPLVTSPGHRLGLRVLAGETVSASYDLDADTVTIGRGTEIADDRGRLIRVNLIAFTDGAGDINATVSRLHAHVTREVGGTWRIFDDGSAQGTMVVRQGRGHVVSQWGRGIVLRSGDEIVLGRARLSVTAIA